MERAEPTSKPIRAIMLTLWDSFIKFTKCIIARAERSLKASVLTLQDDFQFVIAPITPSIWPPQRAVQSWGAAAPSSAHQIPLARNFDTGWEFFTEDRQVIFSSSGEAPPAL